MIKKVKFNKLNEGPAREILGRKYILTCLNTDVSHSEISIFIYVVGE
jgi:hypothetical protein